MLTYMSTLRFSLPRGALHLTHSDIPKERGYLRRCLRVSDLVTYRSTLPSSSPLAALHLTHSNAPTSKGTVLES